MSPFGRDRNRPASLGEKAISLACGLAGAAHKIIVRALSAVGGATGSVWSALPFAVRLAVLSTLLAVVCGAVWTYGEGIVTSLAEVDAERRAILDDSGTWTGLTGVLTALGVIGCSLLAAGALAFVRIKLALGALRVIAVAFAAGWIGLLVMALAVPGALFDADPDMYGKSLRNEAWVAASWAWILPALLGAWYVLCLLSRQAEEHFATAPSKLEPLGDRVLASLRTGGRDGRARSSLYWSGFLHIAVLFFPLLLHSCGMEKGYEIPGGEGPMVIQVVQVKKVKPKRRLVLNMNSPIIFHVPKIDENPFMEMVAELTEDQYQATPLTKAKAGKGKGVGGWPGGMADARVRFIRLKYSGGDWDQDMGFGADYNFLIKFRELTGFKIAANTEAVEVNRLRKFPKGKAPPFVYVTGRGNMHLGSEDLRALRWYCIKEGGMVFADNGGGYFDGPFWREMRKAFPDLRPVDIPSDDPIFRMPFLFPNGAPPLWQHAGRRAKGLKHNGRWIVFYHPGDINDAWKTGHSGASQAVASQAYKMGVNVVYYAFSQYLSMHRGG